MDGPVDANWIENLNTVLDDNKKLCLSSGEIVKLTPRMTMMFEVEDLQEASPATVSRCGMVFMEPERLDWRVLVRPWVDSLPETLRSGKRDEIYEEMIERMLTRAFDFVFDEDQQVDFVVRPVQRQWLFKQFVALFESYLLRDDTRVSLQNKEEERRNKEEARKHFEELQGKKVEAKKLEDKFGSEEVSDIYARALMSLIWGFGGPMSGHSRARFNEWVNDFIRESFEEVQPVFSFVKMLERRLILPDDCNIFAYSYTTVESPDGPIPRWVEWQFTVPREKIPADMEYTDILVPTSVTTSYIYLVNALVHHSFGLILVGETGTGKTACIKSWMGEHMGTAWERGEMQFSATTSAMMVQNYILEKVEKRKKGVYGPIVGKRLLLFVDDLNMPAKERYGAQPPIELLRQTFDNGGFYDLRSNVNDFIQIVETVPLCAMGVPGGGRTDITKRLMRHFNVIYTPPFDEDSLHKIFTSILEWGMRDANESLQRQIKKLTKATIRVYNDVCASLLPLPSKPHYTYNLRCISELFQSFLCMDPRIVAQQDNKLEYMYRLWVHECMRVFADRLVSDADREQVVEIVKVVGEDEELPGVKWNRIDVESLVFSNFKEWNPALTELVYDEITGLDNDKRIEEIIEVYNLSNKDKMQLLMFEYLVQHLARISRIIAKPYGNALLVGIGGNGRNSVSRLASFINGCQLYRVSPAR